MGTPLHSLKYGFARAVARVGLKACSFATSLTAFFYGGCMAGSVRPTQGRTAVVLQVNGGSQSFNAVNELRKLARWMRMPCSTNQSSVPKAWQEFDDDGRMKVGLPRLGPYNQPHGCRAVKQHFLSNYVRLWPSQPPRKLSNRLGGPSQIAYRASGRSGELRVGFKHFGGRQDSGLVCGIAYLPRRTADGVLLNCVTPL